MANQHGAVPTEVAAQGNLQPLDMGVHHVRNNGIINVAQKLLRLVSNLQTNHAANCHSST
jgi:hypothetical protein